MAGDREGIGLGLAELAEHGVDRVKRRVDLLSDLIGHERWAVSAHVTHGQRKRTFWPQAPCNISTAARNRKVIYLGTREHDLARDEDQQHDLRLDHAVDKTGEQLSQTRTLSRCINDAQGSIHTSGS